MIGQRRSSHARWQRKGRRKFIRQSRSHPSRDSHPSLDEYLSSLPRGDEFGDPFEIRGLSSTRIIFQNVHGLPASSNDPKQVQLCDWLREARVDVALLAELNLFWPAVKEGSKWMDRVREVNRHNFYSSIAYNQHGGVCAKSLHLQYGGCTSTCFGRVANGAIDRGIDPTGLGQYAWTRIKGRKLLDGEDGSEGNIPTEASKDLILISAYRPTTPSGGMSTVWIQQRKFFVEKGENIDPRDAFIRDIVKEITTWRTKGLEVILGVDANEDLVFDGPLCFRRKLKEAGMVEAILRRHGEKAPATTQSRESQVPIDGIFVSPGVMIERGGYLGFADNIHSDHRCLWIDIDLKTTLGGHSPSPSNRPTRRLTMMDGKSVANYIKIAESEYIRLKIPQRLAALLKETDGMTTPLTPRQSRTFNCLHKQMYDARRLAEQKCRKLRMGGVPYSPETQAIRDRIMLWKALITVAKGKPISSRRLRRLMKKTELPNAWKLPLLELEENLRKDNQLYRSIKFTPAAAKRRATFLATKRDWARRRAHKSLMGLSKKERLKRMHQREEARRRKKAQGKGYSGGLRAIQIEHTLEDGSKKLVTLDDPEAVAAGCRQENQSRYDQTRAPYSTPPMQEPLYSMFVGDNAGSNIEALVEGRLEEPEVDQCTRQFLRQCRIPSSLSRQDVDVNVEDHIEFWAKTKENKGSEPHGLHNGHYKAGVKSDLLAQCDAIMRDIPMRTGFSPDVWQNLMNFSIEKQPGEFRLSKMRTIQMMNSELQANNKKVGKAAMAYAEAHDLIPPGQCGSRKSHESMALVISKRNNWDLLRLQRRAAGWISNDAKSCFDRIVHWIGMVALYRFGIPWPALLMMFGTLQIATHRVRTGFGDSGTPFFPPSPIPFQGCGQGNGAGPTIWVAVSAILIGAMQAAGFGFAFTSAISGVLVLADCFCFVDDSDVIEAAKSVESSGEEIFASVQKAMNLWAGGVRATGGALNPPKCFWWLIDFSWDSANGAWKFRRNKDFDWSGPSNQWQRNRKHEWIGTLLTQDLDGSLVPLRHLEPNEAEKTLGVMMSPEDDGQAEYNFLVTKTHDWAEKVRSGRLLKHDVLPMISTTIMKTVEYPMALTTFSQSQWMKILSPVLLTCLPKAGVCRFFKRLAVFAPLKYQGFGLPHPVVSQVFHHLKTLMKHLSTTTQASRYIRAVLEGHRLETGTSYEILQQEYVNTAILTTETWVKKIWKEFDEFGIHVETDTWDLELLRNGDLLLMDAFIDALAPQEELKWLNWCRTYLHAVTLSDIVTADGKSISIDAWNGRRNLSRRERYEWPRTCRPTESAWNIWRAWLEKTFIAPGSKSRSLQKSLGKWTDSIDDWRWVYSPSTDLLYHLQGHVWVTCPSLTASPRITNRAFRIPTGIESRIQSVSSLPLDILRASTMITSNTTGAIYRQATITGIDMENDDAETDMPRAPSLHEAWKEAAKLMTETYGWVPEKISIQGDEQFLYQCLIQGKLRLISDGSFKNKLGTAVVQLRPKENGHVIWVRCQTPGIPDDQSSYRSELIGILAGILVASWLLSEWRQTSGEVDTPCVEIACDGLAALRQSFIYRDISPTQPQFDLISSIRASVRSSGIHWRPRHVKGHADSKKSRKKMTWWEKRNIEVDKRATAYRSQLEAKGQVVPRNPRFFSEPCAVFIKGEKMSSLKRSVLDDLIILPQLEEWWEERGRLSREGVKEVDWEVVRRAMKALPAGLQRWCTKHTSGMCAVGKVRKDRGYDTSDGCPLCGQPEDHRHVPRCGDKRAVEEWTKQVDAFTQWSHTFGTAPEITEAFQHCLRQVREPAHKWEPSWSPGQQLSTSTIRSAYQSQHTIGPQGFLEGLLSSTWARAQESYFRNMQSRRSGRKWAAEVSQRLIKIGFAMWEHRNHIFHSESSTGNKELSNAVNLEIRRQFNQDPANLSVEARRQLREPIGKVLSLPLAIRVDWVKWIQAERKLMERIYKKQKTMLYQACTGPSRRKTRVHRSKRLFRQHVIGQQKQSTNEQQVSPSGNVRQ